MDLKQLLKDEEEERVKLSRDLARLEEKVLEGEEVAKVRLAALEERLNANKLEAHQLSQVYLLPQLLPFHRSFAAHAFSPLPPSPFPSFSS